MATTYQSSKVAAGVMPVAGIGVHAVYATYEAATQLVINDIIEMIKVPVGATIIDVKLSVDDLDSGAACVLAVGDGTTATRFISSSTIGQGGGTVGLGSGLTGAAAADALLYEYTADDTIDIKVTTAPAGGGVGTIKLAVIYTMQQ